MSTVNNKSRFQMTSVAKQVAKQVAKVRSNAAQGRVAKRDCDPMGSAGQNSTFAQGRCGITAVSLVPKAAGYAIVSPVHLPAVIRSKKHVAAQSGYERCKLNIRSSMANTAFPIVQVQEFKRSTLRHRMDCKSICLEIRF